MSAGKSSTGPEAINYLDYLANAGFDLADDMSRQVGSMSIDQLQDFRDRYIELVTVFQGQTGFTDFDRGDRTHLLELGETRAGRIFQCPDGQPGEFRPLLHGRILQTGKTMLGGDAGSDFDELNLESRLRRVKGLLLYSHAIVVPDSLFYINQFFRRARDAQGHEHVSDYLERGRAQLCNYLQLIAALRPLIRNGTIIFYPQIEHGGLGFGRHPGFQNPTYDEWVGEQTAALSPLDQLRAQVGYAQLNEIFFLANRYDATAMADSRYAVPMEYLVRHDARPVRNDRQRDTLFAWKLANVELPELDQLPLQEIIALRNNSEYFARWRELLTDAVDKIDNFAELPAAAGLREVQEILREGHNAVTRQLKEESTWRQFGAEAKSFGINVGGAFIATVAVADAPTGGAASLLTFLGQYIHGSSGRRARRALKSHFAAFTGEGL